MEDWQDKALDEVYDALSNFQFLPYHRVQYLIQDVMAIHCAVQGGLESSCAILLKRLEKYKVKK